MAFLLIVTHLLRCFLKLFVFSSEGYLLYLLLNLDRVYMALFNSGVIKGVGFPLSTLDFKGACFWHDRENPVYGCVGVESEKWKRGYNPFYMVWTKAPCNISNTIFSNFISRSDTLRSLRCPNCILLQFHVGDLGQKECEKENCLTTVDYSLPVFFLSFSKHHHEARWPKWPMWNPKQKQLWVYMKPNVWTCLRRRIQSKSRINVWINGLSSVSPESHAQRTRINQEFLSYAKTLNINYTLFLQEPVNLIWSLMFLNIALFSGWNFLKLFLLYNDLEVCFRYQLC